MHWFLFSFCIAGIAVGLAGAYAQWAILRADWPSPLDYTRATLTDAEREAVEAAIDRAEVSANNQESRGYRAGSEQMRAQADILRGLLERTK